MCFLFLILPVFLQKFSSPFLQVVLLRYVSLKFHLHLPFFHFVSLFHLALLAF